MNEIIKEIYVKRKGLPVVVECVQESTAIPFKFHIVDWTIPNNATASFYVKKPSGFEVYQEAKIDFDTNTVVVEPRAQLVAEEGKNEGQLHIMTGTTFLNTFSIVLDISKNIISESSIESTDECSALYRYSLNAVQALYEANEMKKELEEMLSGGDININTEGLEKAITNANAAATSARNAASSAELASTSAYGAAASATNAANAANNAAKAANEAADRANNAGSGSGGVSDSILGYVREEAERVAKQVRSHQNADTFSFLAISDAHYKEGDTNITSGITHAGQAMDLIRSAVHIDFAVNLGDNSWGSSISGSQTTIEDGLEEICAVNKCIDASFRGIPNFRTPGNHDNLAFNYAFNGNEYLDADKLFPLYGAYNAGSIFPDGEKDRGYCYRDFEEFKLRVITMNTCDLKDLDPSKKESMYTSGTQMKWFAETLDLSNKSDAENWGIIIYSHHPLDFGISILCCRVLKAYLAGTTVDSFTRDGITVSYDYTGKNKASIIGNIHGHNHNLKLDNLHWLVSGETTEAIDVKRMCIPNACFQRSNERGTPANTADVFDIDYGEDVTYNKTSGTAQDTAFCVVTVDTKNKMVYSDHYGAGYSQSWSYAAGGGESVKTYTVKNNLTNAINSNASTSVNQGSSYSATITANAGYVINSVSVTMGGTNITSSAYSGGKITIGSVTGDIVITVIASLENVVTYNNVLDEAQVFTSGDSTILGDGKGYVDGYYQSSSGGYSSQASGYVCTGVIPYKRKSNSTYPTIYVKGCEFDTTSKSRFYFYNTSKVIIDPSNHGGTGNNMANITKYYTKEDLGTGYWRLVPTSTLNDLATINNNTVGFFAMSLLGSGANLIITLDEPIE